MVRVISEKLFSPPRSRHSSGETLDKELAARVEVLSTWNSRRLEFSDYESSSDSHWDSEVDFDGDGAESTTSRDLPIGGEKREGTDILRKRKERRRERNKLSAQAYRVRRKEQTAKQQTVLKTLQEDNTRLKSTVHNLEEELQKVRNSLRQRYPDSVPFPNTGPATLDSPGTTITTTTTTTTNNSSSIPITPPVKKTTLFGRMTAEKTVGSEASVQAMDNDQSRRQQISPVVDNCFSKPLLTAPSPSPSPVSGAMNPPPPSVTAPVARAFPSPHSGMVGARHHHHHHHHHHHFGASPFLPTTTTTPTLLPTISEKPDCGHPHPHPHPHPTSLQQQQQPGDLNNSNANANTNTNTNTTLAFTNNANVLNANANANANSVFGMYKNSNMNNNNNLYQGGGGGGEAGGVPPLTDVMAVPQQQNPFKLCKV